ncbi:MAG: carbohydrate kinase family protein [Planctomycetota bacterium]
MPAPDVLCIGNIVVDVVGINVDRIPEEGALALFDRVETHLGGCANNMAIALATLGISVGLSAKVGRDGFGDYCAKTLIESGVDTRGLVRSKDDSTSFSFVMIPRNGNRRILHALAANASFGAHDIDTSLFTGVKWVSFNGLALVPHLSGDELATLMKTARAAGAKIVGDTGINDRFTSGDWEQMLAPCFEHFDILFPSEIEAVGITGHTEPRKMCESLCARGVKIAGVKLGERGCAILSDDGYFEIPAYNVTCVDTLGAGDSFMAGIIAGMLRGLKPSHAAQLGNAVSAHCVQAVGATTGIKPLADILEFQRLRETR